MTSSTESAVSLTDWTNLPTDHPLQKFAEGLPAIFTESGYNEMYGIELQAPQEGKPIPYSTLLILQKFLRANSADLAAAKAQLTAALAWRRTYNPLAAMTEIFSAVKFGGLGYITTLHGCTETPNEADVATFNIYGAAAKNPREAFGDTDAFVRWRVALMELTLQELKLAEATKTIPNYGQGPDPYQAVQIHDYLSVSFFRQPPEIRASSQKIISLFQQYYPETVSYKYFVNVPLVMQWMMGAMKALMSKDSIRKMTWMTYGNELYKYLGSEVPTEYGGKGKALKEVGVTVKYDEGGNAGIEAVATSAESTAPPAMTEGTGAP